MQDQLDAALKDAMRARDALRTGAIRLVRAAIRNAEIDQGKALDDNGVARVLSKEIRQRAESALAYREGKREDLARHEDEEAEVLKAFLPAAPGPEQLAGAVAQAVADAGATSMRDMGAVMKRAQEILGGAADGRELSRLVKEHLGGSR